MINDVNLNYLSPEIAMVALAIIIILGDLVIKNRQLLTLITLAGLLVPVMLTINLWGLQAKVLMVPLLSINLLCSLSFL